MELTFNERRKLMIRQQKYLASFEVAVYVAAIIILFRFGGYIAYLSTMEVPLISIDGIIKMTAIIFMLILTGILFLPGMLIVGRDVLCYFYIRD